MEHVAANAGAFKDSYFKVKDISVFKLTEDVVQTSSVRPSSAAPSSATPSTRYVAQRVDTVEFTARHILT